MSDYTQADSSDLDYLSNVAAAISERRNEPVTYATLTTDLSYIASAISVQADILRERGSDTLRDDRARFTIHTLLYSLITVAGPLGLL